MHIIASLIEKTSEELDEYLQSFRFAICSECINTLNYYVEMAKQVYVWICMCMLLMFFPSTGKMKGSAWSTLHMKCK
jgi:hypothetical protein